MAIPTNYVHESRIVFFAVAFTNTEYRIPNTDAPHAIFFMVFFIQSTLTPLTSSTVEPVSLAGKDILAARL
jgi:glycerol uptake facilitator-like aquaporin